MESYLSLLVEMSQPLEVTEWLPDVLQQHRGLKLTPAQVAEHPDIHILNPIDETLKIDQVRDLQELSSYSPYQLPQSFFIIHNIETASIAAQNALLKILEEPPAQVSLILTTKNAKKILATIQSRCVLVSLEKDGSSTDGVAAAGLLHDQIMSSSYGEIILLTDAYGDRAVAAQILSDLTHYLHQQLTKQPQATHLAAQIQVLLEASKWLEKNANVKLALTECFFQLNHKQPILRP